MSLTYGPEKSRILEGETDSNYPRNLDNRKSMSGYMSMHASRAISWRSKIQEGMAFSRIEGENIAKSEAAKEEIYLCTATSRVSYGLSYGIRMDSDPILELTKRNTPWEESDLSCEEEVFKPEVKVPSSQGFNFDWDGLVVKVPMLL